MREQGELIRIFQAGTAKRTGEGVVLKAKDVPLQALAKVLDVQSVTDFEFTGKVTKFRKTGLQITGSLRVDLEQSCIVSLEPVSEVIAVEVERAFLPEQELIRHNEKISEGELVVDPDADVDLDELENGSIDLWEVLIEEVNLAMNPFPRHADHGAFESQTSYSDANSDPKEQTHQPFSGLNTLINEKKSKN